MASPTASNSLLRSAYSIAMRRGVDTDWEAFAAALALELLSQSSEASLRKATQTFETFSPVREVVDTD